MTKKSQHPIQFVNQRTAQTAVIEFSLTGPQGSGRDKIHSMAEYKVMEDQLVLHFRRIQLVGTFTISAGSKVVGSSHLKGLTIMHMNANKVHVAFQPHDNGSRMSYAISTPPHLTEKVYQKLSESIKVGLPQSEKELAPPVVAQPTAVSVSVADHSTAVIAPVVTKSPEVIREVEIISGDKTVYLLFAKCVPEAAIPALLSELRQQLEPLAHEGIFVVKCAGTVGAPSMSDASLLSWCNLQPGARGLGFWFRQSVSAVWVKYALVAEDGFDIVGLAEKLDKVPEVTVPVQVYPNHILKRKKLGVKDYVRDIEVIRTFLIALMKTVQTGSEAVFPSEVMTKTFQKEIDAQLNPTLVGRLARDWSLDGYLKRWHPTPGVTYYHYSLGAKGKRLLGLETELAAPEPQVATEPETIKREDTKITVPDEGAQVDMPPASAPQHDTLVQVAAMLQKLQQAATRISELELAVAEGEHARRTLEGQVETLTAELRALRAQSQAELLKALLAEAAAVKI